MEATSFRDGAGTAGCVMVSGGLFGDVALWREVLQQAAASRPCPLSHSGDYHVGRTMAVAAVSQNGGGLEGTTHW